MAGCGTVFRMSAAGTVNVLYAFVPPPPVGSSPTPDGYSPGAYLLRARDGNFYGVTASETGAPTVRTGTIFRITPAGVKTTLFSFGPVDVNPAEPHGGLVQAPDGSFYGVTLTSGTLGRVGAREGRGTVFRMVLP